jgi:hypothetical protein
MQQFKQSSMQQFKQAISFDVMFKQPFKVQAVHLSDICSRKLPGTAGKPTTGQGSQADTRTYCATQTAQAILGVSDCRACVVGWCHRLSAQSTQPASGAHERSRKVHGRTGPRWWLARGNVWASKRTEFGWPGLTCLMS